MEKHCWICKNTEDYFLRKRDALLHALQAEIASCSNFETSKKRTELILQKEKLERIDTFFIEKEITSDFLDRFLRTEYKDAASQDFRHRAARSNMNALRAVMNLPLESPGEPSFNFQNIGFSMHERIYLCPICAALFAESASASFEIKEAQGKAEEATRYDDD